MSTRPYSKQCKCSTPQDSLFDGVAMWSYALNPNLGRSSRLTTDEVDKISQTPNRKPSSWQELEADDVGKTALALFSPLGRCITGECIFVDNGEQQIRNLEPNPLFLARAGHLSTTVGSGSLDPTHWILHLSLSGMHSGRKYRGRHCTSTTKTQAQNPKHFVDFYRRPSRDGRRGRLGLLRAVPTVPVHPGQAKGKGRRRIIVLASLSVLGWARWGDSTK